MDDIDEEQASSLGVKDAEGAFVTMVVPGSAAEKAGLQPYDLIVEFEGKKVSSARDLRKFAASTPIGQKVTMKVIRNGKTRNLSLTMGTNAEPKASGRPGPSSKRPEGQKAPFGLGFSIGDYTAELGDEFNLPRLRQPRPVILAVESNSEAARSGLAPGDIILDVNRREVARTKDVIKHLRKGTINILRILKQDRVVLVSLRAN